MLPAIASPPPALGSVASPAGGARSLALSRADEEFVVSLYPLGIDRERAYALAEACGKAPVATRMPSGATQEGAR